MLFSHAHHEFSLVCLFFTNNIFMVNKLHTPEDTKVTWPQTNVLILNWNSHWMGFVPQKPGGVWGCVSANRGFGRGCRCFQCSQMPWCRLWVRIRAASSFWPPTGWFKSGELQEVDGLEHPAVCSLCSYPSVFEQCWTSHPPSQTNIHVYFGAASSSFRRVSSEEAASSQADI